MVNTAILVGNVGYRHQTRLDCCHNDLLAVRGLLEAAGRYTTIETIEDAGADDLKAQIRGALEKHDADGEIFFYFTGHGLQSETEFYFCASDFDSHRPNETGLSNSELHELLRSASPELVVKITDACNSGTLLVKGDNWVLPTQKAGLRNIVQIASCLDSQESLTGDPLSAFTERFCLAALRKTSGPVYYTDIIGTLRDDYQNDSLQIPHFVSQGTCREAFIEDAKVLNDFRGKFPSIWLPKVLETTEAEVEVIEELALVDLLKEAEKGVATSEKIEALVDEFFDGIVENLSKVDISELFTVETIEHSEFEEPTTRGFIIRVLANQKRPDNFVVADIERKRKRHPMGGVAAAATLAMASFYGDDYTEDWHLDLNCKMKRTQLRVTLTPLYRSLKRIILVVTCAPSLENCYIFEMVTQHPLTDFDRYDENGDEVTRKWYKWPWGEETNGLAEQIVKHLQGTTQKQLEDVRRKLIEED